MGNAVAPAKITINVIHPTDSAEMLTAAVSVTATPKYLIDQMIKAGFLPPAQAATQYKLRVAQTGQQLLDHVSLADAGVQDGVTLQVDHATSGARNELAH
jgi:hypothetical protein